MAKQLAFDLGINLDAQRVSGSSSICTEEIELRRLLYWSMYCDDKLAAAYTGRVCTLLVSLPDSVPSISMLMNYIGLSGTCGMAISSKPGSRRTWSISKSAKPPELDVDVACSYPALSHIGRHYGIFVSVLTDAQCSRNNDCSCQLLIVQDTCQSQKVKAPCEPPSSIHAASN